MNTSLSSRIKCRNLAAYKISCTGFKGEGTSSGWKKTTSYGDYKSVEFNNKWNDIKNSIAKKNKVGFRPAKYTMGNINNAGMTKSYADNHQKVTY